MKRQVPLVSRAPRQNHCRLACGMSRSCRARRAVPEGIECSRSKDVTTRQFLMSISSISTKIPQPMRTAKIIVGGLGIPVQQPWQHPPRLNPCRLVWCTSCVDKTLLALRVKELQLLVAGTRRDISIMTGHQAGSRPLSSGDRSRSPHDCMHPL